MTEIAFHRLLLHSDSVPDAVRGEMGRVQQLRSSDLGSSVAVQEENLLPLGHVVCEASLEDLRQSSRKA